MRVHQAALPMRASLALAGLLWLALAGLSAVGVRGEQLVARIVWAAMVACMAGRVFITGRISRWRSVFFIILAWAFIVQFKATLIGLTGHVFVTSETQEVPYCHIAIASSFLTHLYQQYLAFMSGAWRQWSPLTWGAVWLVITLVLGQAWCSWACFYGGLDNGFALLRRKPLVKWVWLPNGVRDLPAAILVAMLLLSLVTLQPIFCLWVCPLKLGTGFLDPLTATRRLQVASFATIGITTLIILPWLTKKRVFCSLICPFGAWQAFVGRLNPYRVRIQPDRCTQCQRCVVVCPTFAIEREGLKQHRVLPYCNRCGECMDACPTDAIGYALIGKPFASVPPRTARITFLLSAWLIGGAVSMWFVPEVFLKLWRWAISWLP